MSRNRLKEMLLNIIKIMTKKPEDMTLDEIREQMALFHGCIIIRDKKKTLNT